MRSNNLPHVKKPCRDCPFRKDSIKGWLGRERMTDILKASSFVCHKKQHLQCAGHMLIKGNENRFVLIAEIMGINLDLSGRELVFNTIKECIEHHG